jgi:hypothetical protein
MKMIATGLVVLGTAAAAMAQQPTVRERLPGDTKVDTMQMTGTVVQVRGNWLLAKMEPLGNLSLFNVQPGREFVIDGQKKMIADLKPGTVLTAKIITRTTDVTLRTTSTLSGTVWYAENDYVILTLDNGQNKEYKVPAAYRFMVEGKPASVQELRAGMKVSATKIAEEPMTEIATDTVITGKAPK